MGLCGQSYLAGVAAAGLGVAAACGIWWGQLGALCAGTGVGLQQQASLIRQLWQAASLMNMRDANWGLQLQLETGLLHGRFFIVLPNSSENT